MSKYYRGTTILTVKRDGKSAMGGDGQLSLDDVVVKSKGRKVRKLHEDSVLVGYAGAAADALALLDVFEGKLKQYNGDLTRASLEMAKEWRMDRSLRRLEAELVVTDNEKIYLVSGQGEVIEPDDDILALGSGGDYALAAARALKAYTNLSAKEIVEAALKIAAEICVYTNDQLTIEELG
ncbi:ATP-dependent protease subunit HslV [bacterium]|nr:ATP-dependent protease subunit HslV [bacterium]